MTRPLPVRPDSGRETGSTVQRDNIKPEIWSLSKESSRRQRPTHLLPCGAMVQGVAWPAGPQLAEEPASPCRVAEAAPDPKGGLEPASSLGTDSLLAYSDDAKDSAAATSRFLAAAAAAVVTQQQILAAGSQQQANISFGGGADDARHTFSGSGAAASQAAWQAQRRDMLRSTLAGLTRRLQAQPLPAPEVLPLFSCFGGL